MPLDPITAALDIGGKVIDRLWPDPAQRDAARLELLKLQQSGELAQITGQLEVNKAEASNPSMFVAGWRPAVGWVCALALLYQFLLKPLIGFGFAYWGKPLPAMPGIEGTLWELLFGMLGIGGFRTIEKVKGVA